HDALPISDITKPSRRASNGREARDGLSFELLEMARIRSNEPKVSGASGASTPPASIMRAPPLCISLNASPIATAPDAHELALVWFGPNSPISIATLQDDA